MSLKELKNLAPWNWDARASVHPPGKASLQDFEKIEASWRQDAKGESVAHTPGPSATPRERRRSGGLGSAAEQKQGWPTPSSTGQGRKAASADRARSLLKRKAAELQTPVAQHRSRDRNRSQDADPGGLDDAGEEQGAAAQARGLDSAPKSVPTRGKMDPQATPSEAVGATAAHVGSGKAARTPAPSASRHAGAGGMLPPRWTPATAAAGVAARRVSGALPLPSPCGVCLSPPQLQVLNQLLCHFRDTGCRHPAAMSGPELVAAITSFCKSAGIPPVAPNIQTLASWLGTLLALERPVKAYAQAQAEARARVEAEARVKDAAGTAPAATQPAVMQPTATQPAATQLAATQLTATQPEPTEVNLVAGAPEVGELQQ
ncbi:hypothetical protein GPECTOR_8g133 [Gonium pectorale]|uniref:Uncharacterized protein n=1 Tax=Gonium pectorale TaxID=33097 RepID=A0A150GSF7_GONPE|nr:hypothetical protein GPECTOR_8g133 [Gonium pectorale]|eukprot:KXZ52741.1 hypothetical protein GPECTOR_8g133 [Gonium pectorale]